MRWMLASFVTLASICGSRAGAVPHPADFGKQWVRQHPLTIMGSVYVPSPHVFNLSQYMGMNMNTMFSNGELANVQTAAAAGVPWHLHFQPSRPYTTFAPVHKIIINNAFSYGGGAALMLPDEPVPEEFPTLGQVNAWMNDTHPEALTYVTAFQNNVGTLTSLVDTIKPDLLMFDRYPFYATGGDDLNEWFSMLMAVRQVSQAHQIPYGGWLQSFQGPTLRVPSESDSRFLAFSLLTAGYTMLNYYIYEEYELNGAPPRVHSMLLDDNGQPTPLYSQAGAANLEYATIGQSLRFLTSSSVRYVPGRHSVSGGTAANSPPTGLSNWNLGAGGDSHILALSVSSGQVGSTKNGMLGSFTDDGGHRYFMLTNLNYGPTLSAGAATLSFGMTFDSSVNAILRLNRLTREPEKLVLSNHTLNLTLPGGTGDLFKYDDGFFAGIPGGDANADGKVDIADLGILATNWQLSGTWKRGDFNFDGQIDISDLGILATNWQSSAGAAPQDLESLAKALGLPDAALPEPTASFGILASAWWLVRRRSRLSDRRQCA